MGKLLGMTNSFRGSKDCPKPNESSFEKKVQELAQQQLFRILNEARDDPDLDHQFASRILKTNKDALLNLYDYGNPISPSEIKTEHAILFYNRAAASKSNSMLSMNDNEIPLISDPTEVTKNCDALNVVLINSQKSCTAIVGEGPGMESNHLLQWMRTKQGGNKSGRYNSLPLIKTPRGTNVDTGGSVFSPVKSQHITEHRDILLRYFLHLEDVLAELKPIAQKVANEKNEIIVLTSNFGQSALMENFVCNARSNNFDLSNILVFPTDEETLHLAQGLGLESFFDEKNFGHLPKGEAKAYGDKTFVSMMYAKVISVQVINMLGYNVLFQDVDVVWYKNPLDGIFTDASSPLSKYDMIFQDDGAHSSRYAPYAANTGFYYVRYNDRTQYFFTQFLYNIPLIIRSSSHQAALIALLAEHSSWYGLQVKVLDGENFPGGFHYHRKSQRKLILGIVEKTHVPYIFHMSWTKNKDNKLLFMKQMGMWYTKDECVDTKAEDIYVDKNDENYIEAFPPLVNACCTVKPLISCHYRDKPSIIPCKDSSPIDRGRPSFW